MVGLIKPGSEVPVELMREQERMTIEVEVGGLDADDSYALSRGQSEEGYGGRLGVVVEAAQAEMLERWGINGGVLVREVVPASAAAEAGIVPGDVITMIGSQPVKSVAAFEDAIEGLKSGASVPLRLIRRGNPMFIGLKLKD